MWFDVLQAHSVCLTHAAKGTDLIQGVSFCFCRGDCHISASKSHEIRKSRMCTNLDACLFGAGNGFQYYDRIGCMITAGNVCRRNKRNDFFIHSDGIAAETFAKVTV